MLLENSWTGAAMDNFTNTNKNRRYKAHVNIFGTTQLHLKSPYIVALWSITFPGFGHLILSKYIRGMLLFIWELFINQETHLNQAMVYSFMGDIEAAKAVLDVRLLNLYIPVYLFAIWDSYRTTVDMNKIYLLAERENAPFNSFSLGSLEINYLDKKNPMVALFCSMTIPSVGQLYINRFILGFFNLVMSVIFIYYSRFLEAVHFLVMNDIAKATSVLDAQWLMYLPSFYFYSIYDAYTNTVENNKLFEKEQRNYLRTHFQPTGFTILKGSKVK
jgi:TM2 domain-containing membrane protein YozV